MTERHSGHRGSDGTAHIRATSPDDIGQTEDAEAVPSHRGWVYIFGSHFGGRDGPLQRKRQFVARFDGDGVEDAVGDNGTLAGVRDLAAAGGRLHVVTGNIDSRDKGSVLPEDHPEGADTVNTHFTCALPPHDRDTRLDAEVVAGVPRHAPH